jgi:hypothetical protein
MRTVRVSVSSSDGLLVLGGGTSLEVSTEVIVEDDADAQDEGRAAMAFLLAFSQGTGEAA